MRTLLIYLVLLIGIATGIAPMIIASQDEGKKTADQLLETIQNDQAKSHDPDSVKKAMLELGKFGKPELIGTFIDLIDYRVPFAWERPDNPLYGQNPTGIVLELQAYPAVSVLIEYGEVAIPKLVDIVKNNESTSLKSKNAVETIRWILVVGGKHRHEALKILQEEAAKESNSLRSNNLKEAAAMLKIEIDKIDKMIQESDEQKRDGGNL
jgi:hypothetical protein